MDKTTVAPGVTREEYDWGYVLNGTKESLLASGLAKPEWFPDGMRRNKRGQIIRKLHSQHEGRRLYCQQVPRKWSAAGRADDRPEQRNGWYNIGVDYTADERVHAEKRRELEKEQREVRDRVKEERERINRLRQIIQTLPPFVPGSMSESEKHHMRILRAMGVEQRKSVMMFAEISLSHQDQAPDRTSTRAGLQLVVNNSAPK